MKMIQIEIFRKIILLATLTFLATVLGLLVIKLSTVYFEENDVRFLVYAGIMAVMEFFVLRSLIKLIRNYNKIYLFKIYDDRFEYLALSHLESVARGALFDKINEMYFNPSYNQKLFRNIIPYKNNGKGSIVMQLEDNEESTLSLHISEDKISESIGALNAQLAEYKKRKGEM